MIFYDKKKLQILFLGESKLQAEYQIYNALGKLVDRGIIKRKNEGVSIRRLVKGFYFVSVGDTREMILVH